VVRQGRRQMGGKADVKKSTVPALIELLAANDGTVTRIVFYAPRAGRTLLAGEGGCASGSQPPSQYLKLGPAVRCRSSVWWLLTNSNELS
jgi:hypothetical protein